MWQKIVTTCSQNLRYVTSVTKMWQFCFLPWLVDFLSQMQNKTAVLPFTFCDNLISVFAVWFSQLQTLRFRHFWHLIITKTMDTIALNAKFSIRICRRGDFENYHSKMRFPQFRLQSLFFSMLLTLVQEFYMFLYLTELSRFVLVLRGLF